MFLLPASLSGEKAGSFTNIHRLVQWHDKVVDGPVDSRSELWFIHHLARRMKAMHAGSTRPQEAAIHAITWDYPEDEQGEPDPEAVLREINGCTVADGKLVPGFAALKDMAPPPAAAGSIRACSRKRGATARGRGCRMGQMGRARISAGVLRGRTTGAR